MSATILNVFYPGEWVVIIADKTCFRLGRIVSPFDAREQTTEDILKYDVYDVSNACQQFFFHNELKPLDELKTAGFPIPNSPDFPKFKTFLQQIIDFAPIISVFSSNYPAVSCVPIGAPTSVQSDIREFQAAAFLQQRVVRNCVEPKLTGSCIVPKEMATDPVKSFVSYNYMYDELFKEILNKKLIYKVLTPPNLTTIQQINSAHPYHTTTIPQKLMDTIDAYNDNFDYSRAEELLLFTTNNKELVKMRRIADESTFFVGDAVRCNVGKAGLTLLVTRIWASSTMDLPKVFIDGEILLRLPQTRILSPNFTAQQYCLAGLKATIPLSDPKLIKEVERAPVVFIGENDSSKYSFHIPTRVSGDGKIEYEDCCNVARPTDFIDSNIVVGQDAHQEGQAANLQQNLMFQTVCGDQAGFAIGERIHSPIHVMNRIISMDQSNISAMQAYIRGIISNLNFVPAERIFGQNCNDKGYVGTSRRFVVLPSVMKKLNIKFLKSEDEQDLIPQTQEEKLQQVSQYLMSQNGQLIVSKKYDQDYKCTCCKQCITPLSLAILDESFTGKLFPNNLSKDESAFCQLLELNATGGCYHCPICFAPYHPECYHNQQSKFEQLVNSFCDFQYGLTSINTPCIQCRKSWADSQPHIGLNLIDPMHQFINSQINFLSYKSFQPNIITSDVFNDYANQICQSNENQIPAEVMESVIERTKQYAYKVMQTLFQNWHIAIQIEKCQYYCYETKSGYGSDANQYLKYFSQVRLLSSNRNLFLTLPSDQNCESIDIYLPFRHLPHTSSELVAAFYVEAMTRLYQFEPLLNFPGAPLYSSYIFDKFNQNRAEISKYLKDTHSLRDRQPPPQLEKPDLLIDGKNASVERKIIQQKLQKQLIGGKSQTTQGDIKSLQKETVDKVRISSDVSKVSYGQSITAKQSKIGVQQEPVLHPPDTYQVSTKQQQQYDEQRFYESTSETYKQCRKHLQNPVIEHQLFASREQQLVALFEELFSQFQEQTALSVPKQQPNSFFTAPLVERLRDQFKLGPMQMDGIKDTLASVQIVDPGVKPANEAEQLLVDTLFDAPLNIETLSVVAHERIKRLKLQASCGPIEQGLALVGNIGNMNLTNVNKIVDLLQTIYRAVEGSQSQEINSLYHFPKSTLVQRQILERRSEELRQATEELVGQETEARQQCEQTIGEIESYRNAILALKEKITNLVQKLVKEEKQKAKIERTIQLNNQLQIDFQKGLANLVTVSGEMQAQGQDRTFIEKKLQEVVKLLSASIVRKE